MTTITQSGSTGSYTFTFNTKINPTEFIEEFYAGNIKQATITEHQIHLLNKQGKEITVDLIDFGLDTLEYIDEELDAKEQFYPNGM